MSRRRVVVECRFSVAVRISVAVFDLVVIEVVRRAYVAVRVESCDSISEIVEEVRSVVVEV